jgi:anti-anti-sigma factor
MMSSVVPETADPVFPDVGIPEPSVPGTHAPEPLLTIDVDDRDDSVVLRASGEVDLLTAELLRTALDTWLHLGVHTVVADLRAVAFVDCAGMGALVESRRLAHRRGVALEIVPGRAVARLAALLDLTEALGLSDGEPGRRPTP